MISIINEELTAYEQDIRELLMAFFPGEKFDYSGSEDAFLTVRAHADALELCWNARTATDRIPLSLGAVRRENKSEIKRGLYALLSRRTGRVLPWGTLTGIRPVKLAEQLLSAGLTDGEAKERLQCDYCISGEKLDLMMDIAHRERGVLGRIPYHDGWSLYIGIPFCPTTCMYCSFTSYPIAKWEKRADDYLDCLRMELRQLREMQRCGVCIDEKGDEAAGTPHTDVPPAMQCEKEDAQPEMTAAMCAEASSESKQAEAACADKNKAAYQTVCITGKPLQTIYIGGGTPTALTAPQLDRLLTMVEEELDLTAVAEYTVESGRPDSITPEKLEVLKQHGIERISINPQTMNQKTLDLIGRRHTTEDVKTAFAMARAAGFDNINMDIIMGLPEETLADVAHTLSEIEAMRPDSLTVHALAIKRAARLNTEGNAWNNLPRAGLDEATEMTVRGAKAAERMGLKPYYLYRQKNMAGNQENVGYAEPGKENLYNILMMEEQHTVIGLGAGSSTKLVLPQTAREDVQRENRSASEADTRKRAEDQALNLKPAGSEADAVQYRVERFENIKNVAEYLPRIEELLEKKRRFFLEHGAL